MTPTRLPGRRLLLAPTLAMLACTAGGPSGPASSPRPASTTVITRGDFSRELLLTGELRATRSIAVSAPQTSLFQMRIQFLAEEGSQVTTGEPLLGFDNSSFASKVRELETQILDAEVQILAKRNELQSSLKDLEIELAEKDIAHRIAHLEAAVDPGILARRQLAERRLAEDKAARALDETRERVALTRRRGAAELDVLVINRDKLVKDLESARNDLELLTIPAPADGLVVYDKRQGTTLRYREGDSCWPGQQVLRLPDLREMEVQFHVSEVDAPSLAVGMPVRVTVDAFPGRQLAGTITHVPSMAVKRSEESRISVFEVTASLAETWAGEMKPGMSTLGRVVVERRDDVPMVARAAVTSDGEHFWLRSAAGRREIRPLARSASVYVLAEEDARDRSGSGDTGSADREDG